VTKVACATSGSRRKSNAAGAATERNRWDIHNILISWQANSVFSAQRKIYQVINTISHSPRFIQFPLCHHG
jgi:hypothetical protein